jgi:hypothetical protein
MYQFHAEISKENGFQFFGNSMGRGARKGFLNRRGN